MICPSHRLDPSTAARRAAGPPVDSAPETSSPYDPSFWKAYLANWLVMVAVAVLYRYADFVTHLGGSELHLGWIVGVGMVGSLLMRIFLGTAIDRYGSRLLWLWGLVVLAGASFGHLLVVRYDGAAIYLLRIAMFSAIAAVFGGSMTFISGRAPVVRMAEMLGMLGTSGFLGMVVGAQLGDLLIQGPVVGRGQVDRMFVASGLITLLALAAAWWATRNYRPPRRRRRPPMMWILRRYSPGTILLVSVAMGFGFGLPQTFLRTYADGIGIPRIGLFFAVYAVTAIVTRVITRRWPERFGLHPMILGGLVLAVAGQVLFLAVHAEWQLLIPGICFGMSHAILFPTAVAEACGNFPIRYRGLATMLILAAYDLGQLTGSPTAGMILHAADRLGLPSYPVMYLAVAALLAGLGLVYVFTRRRPASGRRTPSVRRVRRKTRVVHEHEKETLQRARRLVEQSVGEPKRPAPAPHRHGPA